MRGNLQYTAPHHQCCPNPFQKELRYSSWRISSGFTLATTITVVFFGTSPSCNHRVSSLRARSETRMAPNVLLAGCDGHQDTRSRDSCWDSQNKCIWMHYFTNGTNSTLVYFRKSMNSVCRRPGRCGDRRPKRSERIWIKSTTVCTPTLIVRIGIFLVARADTCCSNRPRPTQQECCRRLDGMRGSATPLALRRFCIRGQKLKVFDSSTA